MIKSRRSRRGNASSSSNSMDGGWNKPSLFMGMMIGMSAMAMILRIRDSTSDLNYWNDLMIASTTNSDTPSTTSTSTSTRTLHKKNSVQLRPAHPAFSDTWDDFQRIEAEQTGRVVGPRTDPPLPDRMVHFLDLTQLAEHDAFAASWLQSREQFQSMKLDDIGICEDAAFFAYSKDDRWSKLRMTADWLDFSIEHLSKWYVMMNPYDNEIPLQNALKKLEHYVQRGPQYPVPKEPALQQTIAVIAFMAYKNKMAQEKANQLTTRNLAATVESLRRAGMGRVVVVGMKGDDDRKLAQEAFALVQKSVGSGIQQTKYGSDITQVGHMQVAFCDGRPEDSKTQFVDVNVPKAALVGLRNAFLAAERGDVDTAKPFLGDNTTPDYWKYVYLTEPDSILNTRPHTLQMLQQSADLGRVIVPHRFQPIPHETDVHGTQNRDLYLPHAGDFYGVIELDALSLHPDKCCDEAKGPKFKPGLPPNFPDCGNFWYMCGFTSHIPKTERSHDRLKQYKLIRLLQGTQFVLLASQEHGRRCLPKREMNDNVCALPDVKAASS
ncbi:expressed unknown protein [Seminavis robusta]|uniref:Uncharacterized protein n=1 Tax=Seminavis robusta TaxID=568900 RepID=A0A9N8ES25_9STRA|nr:expressed unknown protein [Seminavis robusta]|eukprot:Sro1717_g293250.1 n/a (550) ;mRNA; f:7809-9458